MRGIKQLCLGGCVLLSAATVAGDYTDHPETADFITDMVSKHEFETADLESLFAQVEKKQSILEAIARPAEKTKTWGQYGDIFLKQKRIDNGVKFWRENSATLARAQEEFGVPPHIIVAILGVETRYGTYTGNYRVIDALSTLGFDYPPRAPFFRKELENFLLLAREQDQDPLSLTGSYAGAMGYGQFMPSSYRAYAVDFDEDEEDVFKDIWNNTDDAIGSVANYFHEHGWQRGKPVATRARIDKDYDHSVLTEGLELNQTIGELQNVGFTPLLDSLDADTPALAMKLEGKIGAEFWIGLKNFEVITRYNRSQLYALAVYQLSESIRHAYSPLTVRETLPDEGDGNKNG